MNSGDDRLVQLVGKRVSLRHRIAPDSSPGPHLSDAVGELDDGGPGPDGTPTLRVRTRGGTVRVRVADVVAVRAVPPARPKRPSWAAVEHLERICADAWPAPVVRDLGAWQLRAGGGFTRRANSALAVGNPGVPVPDALAEVRRFADEHGIPPVVAAPEGSPWWRAVRDEGWEIGADPGAEAVVLVSGVDALAADVSTNGITFDDEPSPAWWSVFGEEDGDPAARRAVLVPEGPGGPTLGFGVARHDGGSLTGVVRAAVVEDHLYLSRLEVLPEARRSGVGSVLTAAAARWGAERGARYAVLQVVRSNHAARALYEQLGCVEHHRYHYLVPG